MSIIVTPGPSIGSIIRGSNNNLDTLAHVVDNFLTPRLEWRIVAERFEEFNVDESLSPTTERGADLFYDPSIFTSLKVESSSAASICPLS